MGLIVRISKRKGDVHDPEKSSGTTLLSLLERIVDGRITAVV